MIKRLLLLSFTFLQILSLFGQGIEILNKSNEIITNTSITLTAPADTQGIVSGSFKIKNTTTASKNIIVVRSSKSVVSGSENYFCWGLCWPEEVNVSDPFPVGAGVAMPGFTADIIPNNFSGISMNTYAIFDENAPADSVNLTVYFNITAPNSINEIPRGYVSDFQPNPASTFTSFHYSMKPGSRGSVSIYNILGSEVRKIELNPSYQDQRILIGDLQPGNYFYRVRMNESIIKTGKLIISR